MDVEDRQKLSDLFTDAEALKTSMLLTLNGTTEDHAKWISCRDRLIQYSNIAVQFNSVTGSDLQVYDPTKVKSPYDMIWPQQKQIFELVYEAVLKLHGRLSSRLSGSQPTTGFDDLLHEKIRAASIAHYNAGHFRNAVLDGVLAISDEIRSRTGIDLDGDSLCNKVFSLNSPVLVLSDLSTESGKNDQIGFLEILRGIYKGIRNPRAHSLLHDLDHLEAAQHLILLSLMMTRISNATQVTDKEN